MPHVSSGGGGEELSSEDEIKVFQVEGEGEDEERSSAENLKEVKTSLVTEGEEKSVQLPPQGFLPPKNVQRTDLSSLAGKPFEYLPPSPFGYVVSPYHPHHNGALGAISMVNRVPMVPPNHAPSPLSLMMYNAEAFQPPPAHMGIPQVHIDPKTGNLIGIPRPPVYTIAPPGQYHHPVFSPEFAQQFPWHPSSMYPMTSSFRTPPFPGSIPLTSNLPSKFTPPTLIPPHPGIPTHSGMGHHPLLATGPKMEIPDQQESSHLCNLFSRHLPTFTHHHPSPTAAQHHHLTSSSNNNVPTSQGGNSGGGGGGNSSSRQRAEKKKSHIKKPLNAFMLYMKDMRSKVVQECTLKESAAINQILGRRWHNLSREEQSKYYEMARKERQLHMQLYPGWTARDNYAINAKKKKRKRDKSQDGDGNNPKKCRARFGLDQQSSWCKPCRRKKKCIRYISGSDNTAGESEDNIGSVGSSTDAAATPDPRLPNHNQNDNDDLTDDDDDNDSGNGDNDDDSELDVSSDFSLSSPPVPRPPSQHSTHPLNVQLLSRSHGNNSGSQHTADSLVTHVPPSDGFMPRAMPSDRLISHMPMSEQFVSHAAPSERLVLRVPPSDSPDMAQLPTPPSTDSSTTTTSLSTPMLVVT